MKHRANSSSNLDRVRSISLRVLYFRCAALARASHQIGDPQGNLRVCVCITVALLCIVNKDKFLMREENCVQPVARSIDTVLPSVWAKQKYNLYFYLHFVRMILCCQRVSIRLYFRSRSRFVSTRMERVQLQNFTHQGQFVCFCMQTTKSQLRKMQRALIISPNDFAVHFSSWGPSKQQCVPPLYFQVPSDLRGLGQGTNLVIRGWCRILYLHLQSAN